MQNSTIIVTVNIMTAIPHIIRILSMVLICSRFPTNSLLARTCYRTNDLSDNQGKHKYLRKYIPHNGICPCPRQFEYVCNLDTSLCVSPCELNALVRFRAFVYIVTTITSVIMSHSIRMNRTIFQFIHYYSSVGSGSGSGSLSIVSLLITRPYSSSTCTTT